MRENSLNANFDLLIPCLGKSESKTIWFCSKLKKPIAVSLQPDEGKLIERELLHNIYKLYYLELYKMKNLSEFIQLFAKEIAELVKKEVTNIHDEPTEHEEKWYSSDDICKMLKITKATLYRHRNLGYIKPAAYVGRKPLFTQESINEYLNSFK